LAGKEAQKLPGCTSRTREFSVFEADFAIPVVSMTAEDQGQLERLRGERKNVRCGSTCKTPLRMGRLESANVIGEVRGREHPEEIVVVGGHLDSWTLSEGATDNGNRVDQCSGGSGSNRAFGTAAAPDDPVCVVHRRRAGIACSFAYVKQHKAEMANHLGDLVLDSGQGPVKEFQLAVATIWLLASGRLRKRLPTFAMLR